MKAACAAIFGAAVLLLGCGGDGQTATPPFAVDTLPGGIVHVSNTAEGVWAADGAGRWRIEEDLRVGSIDGAGPEVFGSIRDVLPAANGGMWVLDSQARQLRLFGPDGSFERTVGGAGEGPGEFVFNPCAFPGPDREIWVEDGLRRWQRFDPSGALIGQLSSTSRIGCAIRQWTHDGRFVVADGAFDPDTREWSTFFLVHRMDADGQLTRADTFPRPMVPPTPTVDWSAPNQTWTKIIPFAHRATSVLDPFGDFWITEGSGAYSLRRQRTDGDTLLVLDRAYAPVPVPEAVRDEAIRAFPPEGMTAEGGFDADDVPRVYPPFDSYRVGTDGTLWVRRTVDEGTPALDAFSNDGIYLGEVEVPADFDRISVRLATRDHLYGVLRDDLDVPYAVRLRIVRPNR